MKRFILVLAALLGAFLNPPVYADIQIQLSKVHGLMIFAETLAGHPHRSKTLLETFENSHLNTQKMRASIARFKKAYSVLRQNYSFEGYPQDRKNGQRLESLFLIRSVLAEDLEDFGQRTFGLLMPDAHTEFFDALGELWPTYERLIWKRSLLDLKQKETDLKLLARYTQLSSILEKIEKFYGSKWPNQLNFYVALYPIPGYQGSTNAESLGNILSQGVLTKAKDGQDNFGVMVREMAHSFYHAQPQKKQMALSHFYESSSDPFAKYAYQHLNEALATAIGNGWAFKKASRRMNPKAWDSNDYIDGYAKALFEIVENYLESNKTMDESFYQKSIEIFKKKFPDSVFRFDNLLMKSFLITEDGGARREQYEEILRNYFKIQNLNRSFPINDAETKKHIASSDSTVLAIVKSGDESSVLALTQMIPSFKPYAKTFLSEKTNLMQVGIDPKNRGYMVIKISEAKDLERALAKIKSAQTLDPKIPVVSF